MSDLEHDLRALTSHLGLPEAPDLVRGVRARIAPFPRRARRPVAIGLAAAGLALAAALAVPPARSALLDLLRIGGAEIERVKTLPETQPNQPLAPGRPVSLDDARRRADFAVATPRGCSRCTVLFDATIPGGRVTIAWPGRPRVFLMQFRGEATPFVQKRATDRTIVRLVSVAEVAGYWVAGSPHAVIFKDGNGRTLFGRRLASNVLLWERGGVTFRLEGDVTLRRALAIAAGLRP